MIDSDTFWTGLLANLSRDGVMNYKDLKSLDIREFFMLLIDTEKRHANG